MIRATLLAACAALVSISLACFVTSRGSEDRPTAAPTADIQATINAALARIEATKEIAAGEHGSLNTSANPPFARGTDIQPAIPIAVATPTLAGMPAASARPLLEPTPTRTPSLAPTSTPVPQPTATPAIFPAPTTTRDTTPTVAAPDLEPRFDGPALEKEIHQLINAERVTRGLAPLDWDDRIAKIARDHSEDMAANDYFRHDNLKGQSPTDRGNSAGYPCRKELGGGAYSYGLAENIFWSTAYSSYTFGPGGIRYNWMSPMELARRAVDWWMDSPGHRKNILTVQYDKTGIGVGYGTAGDKDHAVYLTQNFC